MKKFLAIIAIASFAVACNNGSETKTTTEDSIAAAAKADSIAKAAAATVDTTVKPTVDTTVKPVADTTHK